MDRKGRCSAEHKAGEFWILFLKGADLLLTRTCGLGPGGEVAVTEVAVVGVQTFERQTGQTADVVDQRRGLARVDARAAHAQVEVDQDRQPVVARFECLGKLIGGLGIVHHGAKGRFRIGLDQGHQPFDIRADDGVCQQDITPAGAGDHLGLGDGGTLVLMNASGFEQADDLGHLVRLDVRAQTVDGASDGDDALDIREEAVLAKDQGGGWEVVEEGEVHGAMAHAGAQRRGEKGQEHRLRIL